MDMLPSLCAAMVRANGDSLVLESGRAPYVVAGTQRQDVAKATLSDNALEALVGQIFSESGRHTFKESGFASEEVEVPSAGLTLSATVLRSDDGISIELKRAPALDAAPEQLAAGDDSLFAAPEQTLTTAEKLDEWEPSPGIFVDSADDEVPGDEAPVLTLDPAPAAQDDSWTQVEPDQASQASTLSSMTTAMPTYESFAPSKPAPVSTPAPSWAQAPEGDLMAWAGDAADKGATTVYLRAGSLPVVRVDDRLDPLGSTPLDETAVNQLISDLEEGGDQAWQRGAEGEWVHVDARLGRVVCRLFADDQGRGLIIRLQPTAAARGLHRLVPRKIKAACDGDGLIVVSGTTHRRRAGPGQQRGGSGRAAPRWICGGAPARRLTAATAGRLLRQPARVRAKRGVRGHPQRGCGVTRHPAGGAAASRGHRPRDRAGQRRRPPGDSGGGGADVLAGGA